MNQNQTDKRKIKGVNYIWFAIALLTLILATFFPPLGLYMTIPGMTAMITAFICAFFVFLGLLNVRSLDDFIYIIENKDIHESRKTVLKVTLSILLFIGLIFFLWMNANSVRDKRLEEKGITAEARVISGSGVNIRLGRGGIQDGGIMLLYRARKGKRKVLYKTEVDIEVSNLRNFYENQILIIKYLPDNPHILKIVGEKRD